MTVSELIKELYQSVDFWRFMCLLFIICDVIIIALKWRNRKPKDKADRINSIFDMDALREQQQQAIKLVREYIKETEAAKQKLKELQSDANQTNR